MDQEESEDLAPLERQLGHRFRDRSLLQLALRHSSWAHEAGGLESNERLEFLGDAVIAVVVAHLLFEANPSWREGDLTRGLQQLVDRRALAAMARELGVAEALLLGRTEHQSGGREKESILADAMEAILGALYLDAGLEPVSALVRSVYGEAVREDAPPVAPDPKTRFQESVMARHGEFPCYELVHDSAIEGDNARFTVRARVGGEAWGEGVGRTKRAAERAAAEVALARVDGRDESKN